MDSRNRGFPQAIQTKLVFSQIIASAPPIQQTHSNVHTLHHRRNKGDVARHIDVVRSVWTHVPVHGSTSHVSHVQSFETS
jgi:hypothetical protein